MNGTPGDPSALKGGKPKARFDATQGKWFLHHSDGRVEEVVNQSANFALNTIVAVPGDLPTDRNGWVAHHPGIAQTSSDIAVTAEILRNTAETRVVGGAGGARIIFYDVNGVELHSVPSNRETLRLYSSTSGDPMLSDAMSDVRRSLQSSGQAPRVAPATPATPAAGAPASPAAAPKSYPEKKNGWNYRTEERADGFKDVYVEIRGRGGKPSTERKVEPGGTFGFSSGSRSPRHTWDGNGWVDPPAAPVQQNAAPAQRPAPAGQPPAQQPQPVAGAAPGAAAANSSPAQSGGAPGTMNAPLQSLTPAQIQQAIVNGVQSALAQLGLQQPPSPGQPAAAPQQPPIPGGAPNGGTVTPAPAPGTFRASQMANGQSVQIGPAPGGAGGFLVGTPQGWFHYANQAAAQAAFQAAAQAPALAVPPQPPAAQPPATQPAAAPVVAPGALNAAPATQQFLHQPLGSSPNPPAGYTPLPYANGGLSLGQDASGNFWVLHPSFGYYRYGTMQEAGAAMIYYANMAPAHVAAVQAQAGPGGALQQAVNAAPQAAQQATMRAMRSIRQVIADERKRLVDEQAPGWKWWGHIKALCRWEYGITALVGVAAGATAGALTASTGGLGVAGAMKVGAGVSVARSILEARLARKLAGEQELRERRARGDTPEARALQNEKENISLLTAENMKWTVGLNFAIGVVAAGAGNAFFNHTAWGGDLKQWMAQKSSNLFKGLIGFFGGNNGVVPVPAPVAPAAAAINSAPPPGPGVVVPAPTGNKLAGVTTISKLPGRAPGVGAAAFVNGPRRVPVAPYDVYVRGGSRVRTQIVEEAVRMRFKGKAGLQQFIDMFGYDPRPGKVAYVPRGPQSLYVEPPAPQTGTRIFVQPPGGPKSMYVLPPESAAPAPRLSTVPYVIGGEESVWSFAQQEMQKGVLSRAANMLPPNLHESFINAMHDTLDKTPKFKSVLLGIPDAANLQWNKIPNGTKVDFAALLSNQEFLDEFRKTATSLRYGSLWRALTQNGNSPEKFFALVRSLYVPAPARAGGIIA